MGQVTSYDCESNVKDANGKTFAKILDQNFAYTEKYGVFIPYPEGLTVTMDPEKPELKEAYSTYEAWILKRGYDWEHMLPYDININELQTCWASGPDIVVSGSIVTILPGTVISLPNWAVLKFHDGEQKYRLIIGTHGATTPVVIRPKNETTGEHWTGFAFEPGDRYGDGPDGVIEILSPFEFRGMRKPYRFHQITKNAQIFV
jgi:hypothetical protein